MRFTQQTPLCLPAYCVTCTPKYNPMEVLNHIEGNVVDVLNRRIYPASLHIENGVITDIKPENQTYSRYILPGFTDAHVHIESSMLTPTEFARLAVVHGTVATVSDPHEIGNVLGVKGVEYMLQNAAQTPLKIYFGAPSCVPATVFETAGAAIPPADIEYLFSRYPQIKYLSEMMNFPGVLFNDDEVMQKLAIAKKYGKQIDGHAPGLRGADAQRYIAAGISTDHECFTLDEALDKLQYGMKIIIREGSAAKNFEALHPLISSHTALTMLCSDDKHPNDLVHGHIDQLVRRALQKGHQLMDILQCACINPVLHYGLEVGLLQAGHPADFIVVNNLEELKVLETYINGNMVAENGKTRLDYSTANTPNKFYAHPKKPDDFTLPATGTYIKVIEALEGQLITNALQYAATTDAAGNAISNPDADVLKLAVVNRYEDTPPALAFIKNFGLKRGAIASSVAHDSHNIIAVGVDDEDLCRAINLVIAAQGGLSVSDAQNGIAEALPLPIAGIMTPENGYTVARQYTHIDKLVKQLGTPLYAPYMTLSFMALLVIPALKLSDKGLFNGHTFAFTPVFEP